MTTLQETRSKWVREEKRDELKNNKLRRNNEARRRAEDLRAEMELKREYEL